MQGWAVACYLLVVLAVAGAVAGANAGGFGGESFSREMLRLVFIGAVVMAFGGAGA